MDIRLGPVIVGAAAASAAVFLYLNFVDGDNNGRDSFEVTAYRQEMPMGTEPATSLTPTVTGTALRQEQTTSEVSALDPEDKDWPTLIYDQSLEKSYSELEPAASAGDKNAMFYLSEVVGQCKGLAQRSRAELEQVRDQLDTTTYHHYESIFERCEGLYKTLGDVSLNELRQAWVESAAAEGHTVSKLTSLVEYPETPPAEEVVPLIYEAFVTSRGDALALSLTYNAAAFAYRAYSEPAVDAQARALGVQSLDKLDATGIAWDYLACSHTRACDTAELEGILTDQFGLAATIEMKSGADQLDGYITAQNWGMLGLPRTNP